MITNGVITPFMEQDQQFVNKLRANKLYTAEIHENYNENLRIRVFALINEFYHHIADEAEGKEWFRKRMIIEAGLYKIVETKKGQIAVARSMRQGSMTSKEYRKLYSYIFGWFQNALKCSGQDLRNELNNIKQITK